MTGKYTFLFLLLSCIVSINHLTSAEVPGLAKASKCIELIKEASSCVKNKGLPDVFDVVGYGLSLKKNKLKDEMKCDFFRCILPLRDECSETFSKVSSMLTDYNVDTCSATGLLVSVGAILLSVLLSSML